MNKTLITIGTLFSTLSPALVAASPLPSVDIVAARAYLVSMQDAEMRCPLAPTNSTKDYSHLCLVSATTTRRPAVSQKTAVRRVRTPITRGSSQVHVQPVRRVQSGFIRKSARTIREEYHIARANRS